MNRRTWKEFITKRSTIWTLSLCLVGAIVLGGMAAVNSSRNNDGTQTETELGQIAYLEEDLETNPDGDSANDEDADMDTDVESSDDSSDAAVDSDSENSSAVTDAAADSSDSASDGGSAEDAVLANGGAAEGTADVSTDLVLGDDSVADTGSSTGTDEISTDSSADDGESSEGVISDDGESAASASDGSSDAADAASSDSEEASSANIISEQALIDAGVSFTDDASLLWPSAGTIAIDYSMDKSVYFATLNQYKYNPALIISSDTGNQVLAAAKGIVESISVDEETGTTLVLNIGNGYRLTYGQLKEPAVSEGDVVEAGDLLAYISEPTKYYSTEGSNLYFAMTKDGEPVDPVLYLE